MIIKNLRGNLKQFILSITKRKKTEGKESNWIRWAAKIHSKKGEPASAEICAYGARQFPVKVQKFGGGYKFYSISCDGCELGASITRIVSNSNVKGDVSSPMCALLYSPLFSKKKVEEGVVVALPKILDD